MPDKPAHQPMERNPANPLDLSDLPPNNEEAVNVIGGLYAAPSPSPSPSPSPKPAPSPSPTPLPPLSPYGGGTGSAGSAG